MGHLRIVWLIIIGTIADQSISVNCYKLKPQIQTKSKLAECLRFIHSHEVETNFHYRIRLKGETRSIEFRFGEIIDQLMANNEQVLFNLDTRETLTAKIHGRLYFVDSVKSLRFLIHQQRKEEPQQLNYEIYYIIVLIDNGDNLNRTLKDLMAFAWRHLIINIYVFVEDEMEGVTLYIYYPYLENRCGNTDPVIFNYFINGTFKGNKLLYNYKFRNLWQCPLKVIIKYNPPFININKSKQITGFEANILAGLAKTMNFSLKFVKTERIGHYFENGTIVGSFQLLNHKDADLMIGEFGCRSQSIFPMTVEYYSGSLNVILKESEPYNPLEILLFPFEDDVWMFLLLTLLIKWAAGVAYKIMLKRFFFYRRLRLRVYIKKDFFRFCLIIWLLNILVISSSYGGSIFNFFRNYPRKNLPETIEEVADNGYKFVYQQRDHYLIRMLPYIKNTAIVRNITAVDILMKLDQTKGKYAVIIMKDYLAYFNSDPTISQNLAILHDRLLTKQLCIYLPKFSYLTEELDYQILRFKEIGLSVRNSREWLETYNYKKNTRNQVIQSHRPLSLDHVAGTFHLLGAMCLISGSVFLFEILSKRYRMTSRIVEFFNYYT